MKLNPRVYVPFLAIAAGLTFSSSQAVAQKVPVSTGIPESVPTKPAPVKPLKFDGQVIASNSVTMTVRSRENAMLTQTFSYSPEVRDQMIKILNKGGYQYGDKVVIHYKPGTTTAVKLQGKPSKPRVFTSPSTSQK
jgi:hypothetical protein